MATKPETNIPPSIPGPQVVYSNTQSQGLTLFNRSQPPGEQPNKDITMARLCYIDEFQISVGTTLDQTVWPADDEHNVVPCWPRLTTTGNRFFAAYPWQFYFHQSLYWKGQVSLTFWAIKLPGVKGKLRISYLPPDVDNTQPPGDQREINETWDLNASDHHTVTLHGFPTRGVFNTTCNYAPLAITDPRYRTPISDYKFGTVRVSLQNTYQPGSVFPDNCTILVFMSYQNTQFFVPVGPGIPFERTSHTTLAPSEIT